MGLNLLHGYKLCIYIHVYECAFLLCINFINLSFFIFQGEPGQKGETGPPGIVGKPVSFPTQ